MYVNIFKTDESKPIRISVSVTEDKSHGGIPLNKDGLNCLPIVCLVDVSVTDHTRRQRQQPIKIMMWWLILLRIVEVSASVGVLHLMVETYLKQMKLPFN